MTGPGAIGRGLALALALGVSAPALGQQLGSGAAGGVAATPQILTLDQDRFYAESRYGHALEAKALAANQALAAENRKIEADLAAEEADLTQKRPKMSAAAFQVLADAFDAKVEQFRKDQALKVDALKSQRDAGRTVFFKTAVPVLADLMRKSGAFAILNHDAVVLAFDSIDITDRAIAAVDATLGDGSALAPGPRLPQPVPEPGAPPTAPAAP